MAETTAIAQPPAFNPWIVAMTVTLATFMEVLDSTITNVSLPHIAGTLGATAEESTWVITSYLVSSAVVLPMSGWLSNLIGRKRFYMICVAIFTCSSFLCGLATSLPMLIFFRILQGAGGGGLQPTEQAILADTFSAKQRGMGFAMYGVAILVAPAIGPTLGGYIYWHSFAFAHVANCPRPRISQEHDQIQLPRRLYGHRTYRHRSWILAICSRQGPGE
jgi:DHA2 family multidrug resistance protein